MSNSKVNGTESTKDAEAHLLDSALTLFSEKGYDATSVREIIEKARVSRPVLYYYFRNKEDLFCRLVEKMLRESNERIDKMLDEATGTRDRLCAVIRASFSNAEDRPEMPRLILQTFFSPEQNGLSDEARRLAAERFQRIVRIVREGIESGELHGGDAESLALMFSGIMDIHVMARLQHPEASLSSEMAEGLVNLYFDGVGQRNGNDSKLKSTFVYEAQSAQTTKA